MPGTQQQAAQGFLDEGDTFAGHSDRHSESQFMPGREGFSGSMTRLQSISAPGKPDQFGAYHRHKGRPLQVVQETQPLQDDDCAGLTRSSTHSISKFSLRNAIDRYVLDDGSSVDFLHKLDQQAPEQGTAHQHSSSAAISAVSSQEAEARASQHSSRGLSSDDLSACEPPAAVRAYNVRSSDGRGSVRRPDQSDTHNTHVVPKQQQAGWSHGGGSSESSEHMRCRPPGRTDTFSSYLSSSSRSSVQPDSTPSQPGPVQMHTPPQYVPSHLLNERLLQQQAAEWKAKQAQLMRSASSGSDGSRQQAGMAQHRVSSGPLPEHADHAGPSPRAHTRPRGSAGSTRSDPTALSRRSAQLPHQQLQAQEQHRVMRHSLGGQGAHTLQSRSAPSHWELGSRSREAHAGHVTDQDDAAEDDAGALVCHQQQHQFQQHQFQQQLMAFIHTPDGSPVLVMTGPCTHMLLALLVVVFVMAGVMLMVNVMVLLHAMRMMKQAAVPS